MNEFRDSCIRAETNIEGGEVFDPKDLGGHTNHGITEATANRYASQLFRLYNWDGNISTLTTEMAYKVYALGFWEPMQLDRLAEVSQTLANTMFRWGLKSGSSRPVTRLQEVLNVLNDEGRYYDNLIADGIMGLKTRAAIDSLIKVRGRDAAVSTLVAIMNASQISYMVDISRDRPDELNERYSWGWSVRCIREVVQYIRIYGLPKL